MLTSPISLLFKSKSIKQHFNGQSDGRDVNLLFSKRRRDTCWTPQNAPIPIRSMPILERLSSYKVMQTCIEYIESSQSLDCLVCVNAYILSTSIDKWIYRLLFRVIKPCNLLYGGLIKYTLPWRRYERDGVSNHRCLDCLLNRLFRRTSKKISKLHVTGLCAGYSPTACEFPAQRASNAKKVSIWLSHNEYE